MSMDDLLDRSKLPTSLKNHIGIEIECLCFDKQIDDIRKDLIKENLQWNVSIGGDASINDLDFIPIYEFIPSSWGSSIIHKRVTNWRDRKDGYEIRIIAEESVFINVVNKVCAILNKHNAVTNKSCGLHVHIDMRNRDKDIVAHNLYMMQDVLYKTQPKKRRTNKYCKRINKLNWKVQTKYRGINIRSYNKLRTLEIRMHEATISAKEINNWCTLLLSIANKKSKFKTNLKTLRTVSLTKTAKEYLNGRIKQYA